VSALSARRRMWTQLPQVANIPMAAAAITAVASHPRIASDLVSTNLPMTDSREA
jgi:hypothetical protein